MRTLRWRRREIAAVTGLLLAAWAALSGRARRGAMPGEGVTVLRNAQGVEVHVLHLGATIQRLLLPGRGGALADVVLGFDSEAPYQDGTSPYMGAVVGRVANRIAGAAFELDGARYRLAANNGPNCLHGGRVGFDKRAWAAEVLEPHRSVRLTYTSPDGEEGFPGDVAAAVTYTLTDAGALAVVMEATATAATPISLAQHSYFNLGGHGSGDVLGHRLTLHGGTHYTPVDDVAIPTGAIAAVAGTPFDFTAPRAVGERIADVPGPAPGGYDHNYVLFGLGPEARAQVPHFMASEKPRLAATLFDPASGRGLRVLTTAPGVQFYSGNFLDGSLTGKGGAVYPKHGGLCLETQGFPNAINEPAFPSMVLRPGERYRHAMEYQFFVGEEGEAAAAPGQ